jgi:hypothetical protein
MIFSPCFIHGHALINLGFMEVLTLVLDFFQYMANLQSTYIFMLIYYFRSIHMESTYFQIYAFLFNLSPKFSPCPLWQVQSSPHELIISLLIQTTN